MIRAECDERNQPIWVQEIKPVSKHIVSPPSLKYRKQDERGGHHRRTRSTEELITPVSTSKESTSERLSSKKWRLKSKLRGRARSVDIEEPHPKNSQWASTDLYAHYESYQQKITGLNQMAIDIQQSDITKREKAPGILELACRYPSIYTDRVLSKHENPTYSLKPFHVDLSREVVQRRSIEEIYIGYKTDRPVFNVQKTGNTLELPVARMGGRRSSRKESNGMAMPVRSPRRYVATVVPKKAQRNSSLCMLDPLKNFRHSCDPSTLTKSSSEIKKVARNKLEPLQEPKLKESASKKTLRINLTSTKRQSINHGSMISFQEYVRRSGETPVSGGGKFNNSLARGDVSPFMRSGDRKRTQPRIKSVNELETESTFGDLLSRVGTQKSLLSESSPNSFITNLIYENKLDKRLKINENLSPLGQKLSLVNTYLTELQRGNLAGPPSVRFGRSKKKRDEGQIERTVYLGILSELMNPKFGPGNDSERSALMETLKRLRGDNTEYSPSIFRSSPQSTKSDHNWELGTGLRDKVKNLKFSMKYDLASLYKSVAEMKFHCQRDDDSHGEDTRASSRTSTLGGSLNFSVKSQDGESLVDQEDGRSNLSRVWAVSSNLENSKHLETLTSREEPF